MPQTADKVLDHLNCCSASRNTRRCSRDKKRELRVQPSRRRRSRRSRDWTKTWEYREKNFAREALTVNPAKACQPLGAVFAAAGFEKTLPFVHGSQGCVAYYRSHFSPPLQGADLLRVVVHDRRRGGVRRPEQHDRRPGQQPTPCTSRR